MERAFNRTIGPLLADASGRLIDGRSVGEVDPDYGPVADALEAGTLVLRPEPEPKTKRRSKTTTAKSEEPEQAPDTTESED